MHSVSTRGSARLVIGSAGTVGIAPAAKLNAPVRSPTVCRRQALRPGVLVEGSWLGMGTPNRASRKRSREVWSNVSEETMGGPEGVVFRLSGETTSRGKRKPSPHGPRKLVPLESLVSRVAESCAKNSPVVPGEGTGGATWSKNPPFSSHVKNNALV